MKRGGPLKRRKRLCSVSKDPRRRAARFIPKDVLKALQARSGGQCECYYWKESGVGMVYMRCPNKADDPHHRLPRSRGGKHTLENLKHLCRFPHHDMCKSDPRKARELGILE